MNTPASLAVSSLAIATFEFWQAARGTREALAAGHTALAGMRLELLSLTAHHGPLILRERAATHFLPLYQALVRAVANEVA